MCVIIMYVAAPHIKASVATVRVYASDGTMQNDINAITKVARASVGPIERAFPQLPAGSARRVSGAIVNILSRLSSVVNATNKSLARWESEKHRITAELEPAKQTWTGPAGDKLTTAVEFVVPIVAAVGIAFDELVHIRREERPIRDAIFDILALIV